MQFWSIDGSPKSGHSVLQKASDQSPPPALSAGDCESLYRAVSPRNLLRHSAEKILLLNATSFRGAYHLTSVWKAVVNANHILDSRP